MVEFDEADKLWVGLKSRADDLFEQIEIAIPLKLADAWKALHVMTCYEGSEVTLAVLNTITPARVFMIKNATKSDDSSIVQDANDILYFLGKVLPDSHPSLGVYAIWNEREHQADSVSRARAESGQVPETAKPSLVKKPARISPFKPK